MQEKEYIEYKYSSRFQVWLLIILAAFFVGIGLVVLLEITWLLYTLLPIVVLGLVWWIRRFLKIQNLKVAHPVALILTDEYLHACSPLVSPFNQPIPWTDIEAIVGARHKRGDSLLLQSLIVLKDREKYLGEITDTDIAAMEKYIKHAYVYGVTIDGEDMEPGDLDRLTGAIVLRSIAMSAAVISTNKGQLMRDIDRLSGGKLFSMADIGSASSEYAADWVVGMLNNQP